MPRYIDADELIKQMKDGKYVDRETSFQRGVNSAIDYWITEINHFPAADVVPKSEVEKLEKELAGVLVSKETELHIPMEYLVRIRTKHPIYQAIKLEVAREIFEEIENKFYYDDVGDFTIDHMDFQELKKKYTKSEGKE